MTFLNVHLKNPHRSGSFFLLAFFSLLPLFFESSTLAGDTTTAEMRELKSIEASFASSDLEGTQKAITIFLRSYPKSSLVSSVENVRGLIFLKEKKPPQAIQSFMKAIDNSPTLAFRQYILYNLASAQIEGRAFNEAEETLRQIQPELLDPPNQSKLIALQVTLFERKNRPYEAIRYLSNLARSRAMTDQPDREQLIPRLTTQALQMITETATLESLLQDADNQPLGDGILLRLASLEMTSGATGSASSHLNKLLDQYPKSSHIAQAKEMLDQLREASETDQLAIGVLLPLKGRLAKFGTKVLQGIELGLGVFAQNEEQRTPLKLVLEDAGEEPESAIQALNRLTLKHHVAVVIGPMLSKGVEAVAQRAQELKVPMVSLSRRATGNAQDFVFHAGVTQQLQAQEIARYAVKVLGLKKFAILTPNDKLGTESSQAFWDAVESLGAEVVGFESYSPSETDFRLPIDKLSGLFYTEARQTELDKLSRERIVNKITKRTRKTEQYFALKPIFDYEAVFIPDESRRVGQIMPTFSYRDVEGIKFLGTSDWNSTDFANRSQSYGENSYFVDAFFPETASGMTKTFLEDYRVTFAQDPSTLEAIAYDATMVLKSIFGSSSRGLTRSEIKDRLARLENFNGATGRISFKNGQLVRNLRVLTVKGGQIREPKI